MRAAVLHTFGEDLSVEPLQPLPPGRCDVVVEVGASGICHTDLSVRNNMYPHIAAGPVIGGHEGAGSVVEIGDEVTRVGVGDRVVVTLHPACGLCTNCLRDRSHLCDSRSAEQRKPRAVRSCGSQTFAMNGIGTFSDMFTCDESSLVRVETDLPDTYLALLGCGMITGVGAALYTARVQPGSTVAVVGCGGVGQSVIQGAVVAGATRIIAIDPVAVKRDLALWVGATDVIDPDLGPPEQQVRDLLRGKGVDVAFDVVGAPEVITSAYRMIDKGGTLVLVGHGPLDTEIRVPTFDLQSQEKTIKGCVAGSAQARRDYQVLINLIESGRLDPEALISQELGLDDINVAMAAMVSGHVIRSVITSF